MILSPGTLGAVSPKAVFLKQFEKTLGGPSTPDASRRPYTLHPKPLNP